MMNMRNRILYVIMLTCGLNAVMLLSGCSSLRVNPDSGDFAYCRLGNQKITGLTINRLDDGTIEVNLESQTAENNETIEAVLSAAVQAAVQAAVKSQGGI